MRFLLERPDAPRCRVCYVKYCRRLFQAIKKEFIQFLYISKSSASEVQSLLYIANDLGYIEKSLFQEIYNFS